MNAAEMFYDKALSYAKWSYIGILFPPAGIALSLVAKNMLSQLSPAGQEEQAEVKYAYRLARWGFWASLWWIWSWVVFTPIYVVVVFITLW